MREVSDTSIGQSDGGRGRLARPGRRRSSATTSSPRVRLPGQRRDRSGSAASRGGRGGACRTSEPSGSIAISSVGSNQIAKVLSPTTASASSFRIRVLTVGQRGLDQQRRALLGCIGTFDLRRRSLAHGTPGLRLGIVGTRFIGQLHLRDAVRSDEVDVIAIAGARGTASGAQATLDLVVSSRPLASAPGRSCSPTPRSRRFCGGPLSPRLSRRVLGRLPRRALGLRREGAWPAPARRLETHS